MPRIALNTEAGQVSAGLARRGIAPRPRVQVVAEVEAARDDIPMAALAEAGRASDWLAEEPDLYTDADLRRPDHRPG
ncbi:hypothetical protein ACE7GA_23020 [Roseomonas sp. CCTCC AB2023176]|uniref:hypothetical protein n=1 Tax=Roseomonas sp. CCTCC AB2023176 TaxID=3342640 RepID=UPI0035DA7B9F